MRKGVLEASLVMLVVSAAADGRSDSGAGIGPSGTGQKPAVENGRVSGQLDNAMPQASAADSASAQVCESRNLALGKSVRVATNGAEEQYPGAGKNYVAITDGSLKYRNKPGGDVRKSDGDHGGCVGWVNDTKNEELVVTLTVDLGEPCRVTGIRYNMGDCVRSSTWGADTMATYFGTKACAPGTDGKGSWTEQSGTATVSKVDVILRKTRTSYETDWLFVGEIEAWGWPVATRHASPAGQVPRTTPPVSAPSVTPPAKVSTVKAHGADVAVAPTKTPEKKEDNIRKHATRHAARQEFSAPLSPEEGSALAARLRSGPAGEFIKAVESMDKMGPKELALYVELVRRGAGQFKNDNKYCAIVAARLLGRVGPRYYREAVELLIYSFKERSSRESAAFELRNFGPIAAVAAPDLVRLLEDGLNPDFVSVRQDVVGMKLRGGSIQTTVSRTGYDVVSGEANAALDALDSIGAAAKPVSGSLGQVKAKLLQKIKSDPVDRKIYEAMLIRLSVILDRLNGVWQGKPASQWMSLLGDQDIQVQRDAVNALVNVGPFVLPELCAATKSSNAVVAQNACYILGCIGHYASPALRDLEVALKHKDPKVRAASAKAVGEIVFLLPESGGLAVKKDEMLAVSLLKEAQIDPSVNVQEAAELALEKLSYY